jgi:hypothetical protein
VTGTPQGPASGWRLDEADALVETGGRLEGVESPQEHAAIAHGTAVLADHTGVAVGDSPELDGHQAASVAATGATPGAHAVAALADRGRLDAAALVYRDSPTDENLPLWGWVAHDEKREREREVLQAASKPRRIIRRRDR